MSEERFCELCHELVWYGAYGTVKTHVNYSLNIEFYQSREKICTDCIEILNKLPIIEKDEP